MQPTTGRGSSSSPPSSWGGDDAHRGPHWILTVLPNGKLILTTPDEIDDQAFQNVGRRVVDWLNSDDDYPLMIGNCLVQVMAMPVKEVLIERSEVR